MASLLLTHLGLAAESRPPWTSNRLIGSPYPPPLYLTERLFPKLQFEHPVDLAFFPGTDQLVVVEQEGRIWLCDTRLESSKRELMLDLRKHHRPLDNILGFTFHPGFRTNRYIFINYNEPGGRTNGAFVSRFTVSNDPLLRIDPSTETIMLRWLSGGHNGCTLLFGNDGFLYISAGDAANPDPPDFPYRTGQDISDLLASILRIDVDHAEGDKNYRIPPDNPFVGLPGARPEVWAFGFRNPFRMSIDRPTGDLWVGDVGWEQWEMIYRVRRGGNYGWSLVEGPNTAVRKDITPGPGPILSPMVAISHVDGASITGGYVYHGTRLPKLSGAYLYGDWETGKFWALRHRGDELLSNEELCDTALKPVSFTLDPRGELLILDYNGGIYRFVPNDAAPRNQTFPRKLSETGLFTSMRPLTPAAGVVPYQIRAPMWNDYARADWLLGVPGTEAIATDGGVGNIAGSTWFFPSNTVLARTLNLEMQAGQPETARRIETQILHWDGQAWNPYSYRWTTNQTDAELVPASGTNDLFMVQDASAPGGERATPWRFAGRTECLRCHNAWAGETLTLNVAQLGNPRGGSAEGSPARLSEFQRFESLGLINVRASPKEPGPLGNPYNPKEKLDARARSWLHVNCATCHRFGAGGTAAIHLNADKLLTEARAINEKPLRGDFGITGARIIASGSPYQSTLFYRINTESAGRMPHIGSRLVDPTGVGLLRDWISSLDMATLPGVPAPPARLDRQNLERGLGIQLSANNEDRIPAFLFQSTDGALMLMDGLTRPTANPALRVDFARHAQQSTNVLVRDLFQRFLPPGERRQTLGTDFNPAVVLSIQGKAEHGRKIFQETAQCSRCHQCEGSGRAFGPDLTGIRRKYTRAQILDQITAPSRSIAPEYKTVYVTLRDENELSGFLVRRTADELVLREETAGEHHLKLSDIKETRESTLSLMPEGLLAPLTPQEAADLLDYLFGTQPSPVPNEK